MSDGDYEEVHNVRGESEYQESAYVEVTPNDPAFHPPDSLVGYGVLEDLIVEIMAHIVKPLGDHLIAQHDEIGLSYTQDLGIKLLEALVRTKNLKVAAGKLIELLRRLKIEQTQVDDLIDPTNKEFKRGWQTRLWDILICLSMDQRLWVLRELNARRKRLGG